MSFNGPLFVVGSPRSGTKLIRGLLNGHSRIDVSMHETEFLPFWVKKWPKYGDLARSENFADFYAEALKIPYFQYFKDKPEDFQATWFNSCTDYTPAGVFEALIKLRIGASDKSDLIWGDKSPSYINHLDLLKELYPEARFIHIVRDVRDHCISCHKAWGKHHIRTAQRWVDGNARAQQSRVASSKDYLLIHYESVLRDTEAVLRQCCEFLGVQYEANMQENARLVEGRGDAKGYAGVKQDNVNKYVREMSPGLLLRIEKIAGKSLEAYGYEVDYKGPQKRASDWQLNYYKFLDGFNLVMSRTRNRSLLSALRFQWQHFKSSGNNN